MLDFLIWYGAGSMGWCPEEWMPPRPAVLLADVRGERGGDRVPVCARLGDADSGHGRDGRWRINGE